MTLAEAAKFIRVSHKTLGEMARTRRIPCQKVGREWRFLRRALENWLSGRGVPAVVPETKDDIEAEGSPEVHETLLTYATTMPGFRDTAFAENRDQSLHRWVPWIAGFSASFVDGVLDRVADQPPHEVTVLDPFAGVGTTLVEALRRGQNAVGFEINPYAALACKAKLNVRSYDVAKLAKRIGAFEKFTRSDGPEGGRLPARRAPSGFRSRVPFFAPGVERQVLLCLDFIHREADERIKDLFRVALGSVMVGFSNYSYEPSLGTRAAAGKPEVKAADVAGTVARKLHDMALDIRSFQESIRGTSPPPHTDIFPRSYLRLADELQPESVDILITSPPYLNNYHYVRNTRPQMFWLSMVAETSDLKVLETESFGQFWQTVRSGPSIRLRPDVPELSTLIEELRQRNPEKGHYGGSGWANYAACYFNDCDRFCEVTRRVMRPGATVVVVIGNNILQGIEFQTDRFFAEIAERRGFELVELHEVRRKRTGSSIVGSSVRMDGGGSRARLYETAVELRAPQVRVSSP